MKTITINLPEKYLTAIQVLIDLGKYPSRTEFVRKSIRECLEVDLNFSKDLENEINNQTNMEVKQIESCDG